MSCGETLGDPLHELVIAERFDGLDTGIHEGRPPLVGSLSELTKTVAIRTRRADRREAQLQGSGKRVRNVVVGEQLVRGRALLFGPVDARRQPIDLVPRNGGNDSAQRKQPRMAGCRHRVAAHLNQRLPRRTESGEDDVHHATGGDRSHVRKSLARSHERNQPVRQDSCVRP